MDDRGRPLTSEDTVRESLIGLLKATGIVGGLGGNQSAYSTSATAADYHQPGGYSTASKQLEQLPGTASQYTPSSGNQYGQTAAATSQYGQTAGTGSQYGQTTVAGSQFGQAAGASAQYGQAPGAPQYGQTGTGSAQYGQTAAGAQYAATPAASQYGASTAVAPQYSTVGASQYAPVERGSGAVTQFTSERAAAGKLWIRLFLGEEDFDVGWKIQVFRLEFRCRTFFPLSSSTSAVSRPTRSLFMPCI